MFNNFRERSNQCHSKQFSCLCKYRFLAEKLHFFKKSALQFYITYPRACETFPNPVIQKLETHTTALPTQIHISNTYQFKLDFHRGSIGLN